MDFLSMSPVPARIYESDSTNLVSDDEEMLYDGPLKRLRANSDTAIRMRSGNHSRQPKLLFNEYNAGSSLPLLIRKKADIIAKNYASMTCKADNISKELANPLFGTSHAEKTLPLRKLASAEETTIIERARIDLITILRNTKEEELTKLISDTAELGTDESLKTTFAFIFVPGHPFGLQTWKNTRPIIIDYIKAKRWENLTKFNESRSKNETDQTVKKELLAKLKAKKAEEDTPEKNIERLQRTVLTLTTQIKKLSVKSPVTPAPKKSPMKKKPVPRKDTKKDKRPKPQRKPTGKNKPSSMV